MARRINEVPQGFHAVIPCPIFTDGARTIYSYGWAVGVEELSLVDGWMERSGNTNPSWDKRSRGMIEGVPRRPEGLQTNGGGRSWPEQRSGKDLSISGKWMCP